MYTVEAERGLHDTRILALHVQYISLYVKILQRLSFNQQVSVKIPSFLHVLKT